MMLGIFEHFQPQLDELLCCQPLLKHHICAGYVLITGAYCIRVLYEDEEFEGVFEVEAIVSFDFPLTLPKIREVGGKIRRRGFEHIYPDRELCLEVDTKVKIDLLKNPSLIYFFETYVTSYFFSYLYYEKYRKFPFGERSHGEKGILEYYCELFMVRDPETAKQLLHYLCGTHLKGHHPCPCMSGNRYRNCHLPKIIELKNSPYYLLFQQDYALMAKR